ncbi:MAG: 50S ribosomal protein L6 [Candidatus Infernicultor aquiphilus]|uniref:Large ribosomal subunit protein uL6 n=1 Tax=Candidatus Infernicultor aquiphilus TaxID=1805029 RepID=A0A1J5H1P8_9BACT|nr:50S ribosomal protein L6 [bacterium]OIP74807.1 MAG: 50S ribosomal protein L6 [Candidatus Atribacteria bacterium CG2_30_33_13]PIU25703.1 MAG: 50S ribosomal protein L6 [Candidatus Atribacteria bacterium CG08_land_8_20_14_0_20_33_29]PIW12663.1 MAG: 50S ribosomal protein L6 [Candidatus Atribacteria bacterium CG17_big_fil_post_rev_8_21_14_2_50_34_11]PIX33466.1 MAG: 50S ribosomal protein L6 [Candidatus Atribacteria bacterium CG_4_8_14_3_um_filter_34_18]PIY32393.1 MAG: 50S ribosomal protein L6 [Ca
MSRIGKMPITIPKGVKVEVNNNKIKVSGEKGTLERIFHSDIPIKIEENKIYVSRISESKFHRALHGLTRSLINNMVKGVSLGFEKVLEIQGVGYRATLESGKMVIQIGYSHPIKVEPPEGIEFEVEKQKIIKIRGIDKQLVGETAAKIRILRKPEPYKGKGIRYIDEVVRRKIGKTGAK